MQRRRLLVVLILEGIPHIREVLEQLCDQLFLLFGRGALAIQNFNALARGDILHVSACAFTADEAGFLNQPRHLLQSTLLPKHLWERDLAVCPQHLLIAFPTHLLVRLRVNIRVRGKDMIADVLLNGLFEKQLADAITEHTEDGFERFAKDLRQEVSGVLALQIAAVKLNCFVNEVILRRAAVQLVVVLHLAPRRVIQSDGMTAFFLRFYGVHPPPKTKSAKIMLWHL